MHAVEGIGNQIAWSMNIIEQCISHIPTNGPQFLSYYIINATIDRFKGPQGAKTAARQHPVAVFNSPIVASLTDRRT